MSMIAKIQNKFLSSVVAFTEFKKSEKGVTAVEYAVVIAGVTAIVLVIFGNNGPVATMLNTVFTTIENRVTNQVTGAGVSGA